MATVLTDDEVIALETAERQAVSSLYAAADPEFAAAIGLTYENLDEATLTAVNRFDVLAMNRVVGLGLSGRPSDALLGRAIAACRRAGSPRFFMPVAPLGTTADLGERLQGLGLRHYNNWVRLHRELRDLPEPKHGPLAVRRIDRGDARVFGDIVAAAFGFPPAAAPFASVTVGAPGWSHYLCVDGETPIGAAAMHVDGQAAWFGFAATDEKHRGRGAQAALIVTRMHDAVKAGCRTVSVETAQDSVDHDAPSFRNMKRLGFTVAYLRPNYLWTAAAPEGGM